MEEQQEQLHSLLCICVLITIAVNHGHTFMAAVAPVCLSAPQQGSSSSRVWVRRAECRLLSTEWRRWRDAASRRALGTNIGRAACCRGTEGVFRIGLIRAGEIGAQAFLHVRLETTQRVKTSEGSKRSTSSSRTPVQLLYAYTYVRAYCYCPAM